ncbi:MAG: hypothetical protein KC431_18215 [Myxococcales bacterium]|nr:hypothetical protein [Myxococcales bacterium]
MTGPHRPRKRVRPFAAALTSAALALSCAVLAAPGTSEPEALPQKRGRDKLDVDYARDIHANTTDPAFLSEWVDHLPSSRTVPSPKAFLGYSIGSPGVLTQPERINDYFRALAKSSDRVQVFSMGNSRGGASPTVAAR